MIENITLLITANSRYEVIRHADISPVIHSRVFLSIEPRELPKTGEGERFEVLPHETIGLLAIRYLLALEEAARRNEVTRDVTASRAERMEAAVKAAPYVHPRLAAIEHTEVVPPPKPIDLSELTDEERNALLHAIEGALIRR